MAGRASIVGAAATHVGKVREHNEDAHFLDLALGMFLVCDGMGGHAAGEVASAIAVKSICQEWASGSLRDVAEQWLDRGTPDTKKRLIDVVRAGVFAAHSAILAEAKRDRTKHGMGTTLVGAMVIGNEAVFAHAGDSRAYLVRDGIAMQLTEDHTLLARLLAAGIDVDVSGEGSRFRSMLTNALGIGDEVKVSTFVVPLADGDWFMLCSDGISEYVPEAEVGTVLSGAPSPERAADRLVQLALDRGGGDNATAVVVHVLEAGETPAPAEQRRKDDAVIATCPLWGKKLNAQQRLRALRIAIPRDHATGDKLPPHTLGDRVAWLIVEGELVQDGQVIGPGALVYPESLVITTSKSDLPPMPERDALAVARGEIRALAIRADDFRELCDDESELGDELADGLTQLLAAKKQARLARSLGPPAVDPRAATDPHMRQVSKRDVAEAYHTTDPNMPAVEPGDGVPATMTADGDSYSDARDRAATVPDDASAARPWLAPESPVIAPVVPGSKPSASGPVKRIAPPAPGPAHRPSPLPAQLSPRGSAPAPQIVAAPPAAMRAHPALSARPEATPIEVRKDRRSEPKIELKPVAPATAPTAAPAPAPAPIEKANRTKPGDWDEHTERIGPPLRRPAPSMSYKPTPAPAPARKRPPTEPEIETVLEIEAELPPAAAAAAEDDYDAVSIIVEDGASTVPVAAAERSADSDYDSVTVTVDEAARSRRVTVEAEVLSGTLEEPPVPPSPTRRTKRFSGGG